jgi:hypothetical protein
MNAEDGRIALGTFIDPKDGEPLDENVEVCCLFAI